MYPSVRRSVPSGIVVLTLLLGVGCSDNGVDLDDGVDSLTFVADDMLLALGGSSVIHVTARTEDGRPLDHADVVWSSTDSSIVGVESDGGLSATMTGHAQGTADVMAHAEGATAVVTVTVADASEITVATISLEPDTVELTIGGVATMSALARDAAGIVIGSPPLTWTISDSAVVALDSDGDVITLTGLIGGSAEITVSAGSVVATGVALVFGGTPTTLTIHGDSTIVKTGGPPVVGQSALLTVSARDADGDVVLVPFSEVEWTRENAALDSRYVPDGILVRAGSVGPGTARVEARWRGLSDALDITILAAPPAGEITLMTTTTLVFEGEATDVWLWALDAQGNEIPDSLVTLTSDHPDVVSLSWTPTGWRASGDAAGFTQVRATYGDMVGVAPLRVEYRPLELFINGPDTLVTGETVVFSYTHHYGGGWFTNSSVSWSVSDSSVLRVVGTPTVNGSTRLQIEAIAAGTAEVRISATGPHGTFTSALPVRVLSMAGTTRIIHQLERPGALLGVLVWLVPELGLTRDLTQFYAGDGAALRPSARSDGTYAYVVTYTPFDPDLTSIVITRPLSSHSINFAIRDGQPALHPTEDLLAFTISRGGFATPGPSSIAVAPFSGATMDSLALGTSPTWSPNGDTIAFVRGTAIYKISRSGGPETLVADIGVGVSDLDWSPDGQRFIFAADGVRVMNADGTNVVLVADGGQPDWGPDSQQFVFVEDDRLAIGRLGSSTVTYLPSNSGDRASFPVWFSAE